MLSCSGEAIMDLIEIVHVRAYSEPDRDEAVAAFHQLAFPDSEESIEDMILLKEISVASDLCILIHWHGEVPPKHKSPLGLQVASAFSQFGQIDHSIWIHEWSIPLKARSINHEKKR
jgi:hypothetical protein